MTPEPKPESVTAVLTADHRRIDAWLAEALERARAGAVDAAKEPFQRFSAALSRHIEREEQVLFPLFDARTGIVGPTVVMRREHRMIEEHLTAGGAALDGGDARRFEEVVASLEQLLAAHNMKEERILYPKTDAALGPAERAELAARLVGA